MKKSEEEEVDEEDSLVIVLNVRTLGVIDESRILSNDVKILSGYTFELEENIKTILNNKAIHLEYLYHSHIRLRISGFNLTVHLVFKHC